MKNLFLTLILLASSAVCMAQINLREGIVITLSGDTLHGSIDYRTDQMNAEQCLFVPDGKSESVTYKPGEIAGYRFLDNGRLYVTKKIKDDKNNLRTFFLEYVVRGQLSLYRLSSSIKEDTYLLEDENGQLVQFSEEEQQIDEQLHRTNLKPVLAMTSKSQSTQKMLWKQAVNRKTVTKAVVNYNNEVCPDGICEILEYKNKKTPNSEKLFRPTVKIGMVNSNLISCAYSDLSRNYTMQYSVGVDYYAVRLSKGLFASFDLSYYQASQTEKKYEYYDPRYIKTLYAKEAYLTVGAGYQWKRFRFQPRLYGGYAFSTCWVKEKCDSKDYGTTIAVLLRGYHFGAGVVCPIKKGAILIDCKSSATSLGDPLWMSQDEDIKGSVGRLSLSIGYQFGY